MPVDHGPREYTGTRYYWDEDIQSLEKEWTDLSAGRSRAGSSNVTLESWKNDRRAMIDERNRVSCCDSQSTLRSLTQPSFQMVEPCWMWMCRFEQEKEITLEGERKKRLDA